MKDTPGVKSMGSAGVPLLFPSGFCIESLQKIESLYSVLLPPPNGPFPGCAVNFFHPPLEKPNAS